MTRRLHIYRLAKSVLPGLPRGILLSPSLFSIPMEARASRRSIRAGHCPSIHLAGIPSREFISEAVGKKVPYEKWEKLGTPQTLLGAGGNKYWVAYLPSIDVSFIAEKRTDILIFADRGTSRTLGRIARMEEARKERIEAGFSAWDGSHRGLTKTIKEFMNDLKSYEHVETKYWDMDSHLVVTTTFRGKNAFGGVVKNWVKAKADLDGNVIEIIEQGP